MRIKNDRIIINDEERVMKTPVYICPNCKTEFVAGEFERMGDNLVVETVNGVIKISLHKLAKLIEEGKKE